MDVKTELSKARQAVSIAVRSAWEDSRTNGTQLTDAMTEAKDALAQAWKYMLALEKEERENEDRAKIDLAAGAVAGSPTRRVPIRKHRSKG